MKKEKSYLILAIVFMVIGIVMIGLSEFIETTWTYYEIASIFMLAAWIFAGQYRWFRFKRRNLGKQDEILGELKNLKQRL